MLEKPKFVPMARPYASYTPHIFIFLPFRVSVPVSFWDDTPSTPVEINLKQTAVFKLILTGVVRYRQR